MNLKMRYFTVTEAEALIPEITRLFESAQETKTLIEQKVENWRRVHKSISPADEAVLRGQVDYFATQLESQLGQIGEMGCLPKDLDLGLVDFPARINDQEGYLCWKKGEKEISHWHGITEGYEGRKPLKKQESKK